MSASTRSAWPDNLSKPDGLEVAQLLDSFWSTLEALPDLLLRQETLLAVERMDALRRLVLHMMLALNGIQYPSGTRDLNSYLSDQQRAAIQRTLLAPSLEAGTWIGQAVALVVIYRWYAPQLVEQYAVDYPSRLEQRVWAHLLATVPEWPRTITSD